MAYTSACAVFIATSQCSKFAGFSSTEGSQHFAVIRGTGPVLGLVDAWIDIFSNLDKVNWLSAAVGITSLLTILICKRKIPALPAELFVVIVGTAATTIFDWAETYELQVVGAISPGLPKMSAPLPADFQKLANSCVLLAV